MISLAFLRVGSAIRSVQKHSPQLRGRLWVTPHCFWQVRVQETNHTCQGDLPLEGLKAFCKGAWMVSCCLL